MKNNYSQTLNFESVSPKKVSDFIFTQLEQAIILKELLSEQQLPTERELAAIFNVSRLTIREALSQLEAKKLIEKKLGAKGGTFVLPLTKNANNRNKKEIANDWESMKETFEYREIVEPNGAYFAAKRITNEEIKLLQSFLEASIQKDCTREQFRALDVKFHLAVAKASKNSYFERAVRDIRTKINPALDLVPYEPLVKEKNYHEHTQLLEAFKSGDAEKSKLLMKNHIKNSMKSIYEKVFSTVKNSD